MKEEVRAEERGGVSGEQAEDISMSMVSMRAICAIWEWIIKARPHLKALSPEKSEICHSRATATLFTLLEIIPSGFFRATFFQPSPFVRFSFLRLRVAFFHMLSYMLSSRSTVLLPCQVISVCSSSSSHACLYLPWSRYFGCPHSRQLCLHSAKFSPQV